MARRKELMGVCNDLLDSFTSRYNDLDGYWALGKFQKFLAENATRDLSFDLVKEATKEQKTRFYQTSSYYRGAVSRLIHSKNMPIQWLCSGQIAVKAIRTDRLLCVVKLVSDLGRIFQSQKTMTVRPHDPRLELQSGGKHGPGNQKGQ